QLLQVEVLVGLVEQVAGHVVDGLLPLFVFNLPLQRRIGLDLILEFLEEHPVDLHAFVADLLLGYVENRIGAGVLVEPSYWRWWISTLPLSLAAARRQLEHFVVVELFFEVFAVGEKVEELEADFL